MHTAAIGTEVSWLNRGLPIREIGGPFSVRPHRVCEHVRGRCNPPDGHVATS